MIQRGPRRTDTLVLIESTALTDGTLSFKARGILAYLLTLDPAHPVSVEGLARHGTDGKRAVESGLRELEEAGYLVRDTVDGAPLLTVTDTPDGVEAPTPSPVRVEVLVHPADAPRHWMPTEQAIRSAKESVEILDWKLYITHYLVRCKERGTRPDSGEWLRWLLQDEQKERINAQKESRENRQRERWYSVAD